MAPSKAVPHPSQHDLLRAYARLWAVTEFVIIYGNMFLVPGCESFFPSECVETPVWFWAQCVLWLAILAVPSRLLVSLSMLVRVSMFVVQSPMIWESCHWANALELACVVTLLLCPATAVVDQTKDLVRTMISLFYIGAGFWKMNTSFLDPTVSCGTIYIASLLATFAPEGLLPPWLVTAALGSAPWMTIIGEMSIGVLLLLPSRPMRRAGFVLSNMLHYAICITPHPNAVPLFGVFCYTRLFFVMPEAWTVALAEVVSAPRTSSGLAFRVASVALAAWSASLTSDPGIVINWGIPAQTILCLIGARVVLLDMRHAAAWAEAGPIGLGAVGGLASRLLRANGAFWVLAVLFYVFGAQTLGLMDISATSPFSHIREHGGSNHLLMPTSLLQQWEWSRGTDGFGGGVVRITSCSSDYLNALYPCNVTDELRPGIRDMLHSFGHIGHEYHPTVMRMFGSHRIRRHLPHWDGGRPFPVYTVPGLELRRMLAEARAANESFVLEYDTLPGVVGDEKWRHTAVQSKVRLEEDGAGGINCRVLRRPLDEAEEWAPCGEDELPLQPAPTGLLMKFLVWFPYPVVEGVYEIPCID
ncbi:hypothetical protein EMIHUDRAFT_450267 [Emiliania huxleyi CCMP1516]|uniref:Mannosyltransferase n=2 Tax=Emiliania huxleyi TaxID=2903 RepID=A0A0D3JSB9_EMIH1|nr:hypothetical protein EMIHUDRAFT_450267 [Emiliania huxleyi CCMP1516]EOD26404.1 hypothetical protein EMIHUDRAFT_450267 [Emiliania huxleyi CCMP1516]|eukprot:XP_005778833.1 hypothetical protein EMIHUDRAFT_450267 [Emiliania huxleyi CCMP1516]